MARTVVGVFDNANEAQRAVQELINRGFSEQYVDITSRNADTNVDTDDDDNDNGITRFFKSLFGDDDNADRYSKVARKSGTIVTVHAQSDEEAERAADILDDYGAVDVDERATQYGYTSARTGDTVNTSTEIGTDTDRGGTEERSIPVIEEDINIGKRTVEKGGVRVRSRIVERPVEENIRLREERVWVERNPVDRPVEEGDLRNFQETEIELTERTEVPVVNKEARVVEEVRVGKDVEERNETIRDTVRSTDVEVENLNKDDVRSTSSTDLDDDVNRNDQNRNDLNRNNW